MRPSPLAAQSPPTNTNCMMSSETNHFSKMTIFISCLWTTANPPPTVRHRPNIGEIGSSDRQHDAGGNYGINDIRSQKKIKKKTDRGRFIAVTSTLAVYEHFRLKRVTISRIFCLRPPPEFLSNEPVCPCTSRCSGPARGRMREWMRF